jgi:hypothetical protein
VLELPAEHRNIRLIEVLVDVWFFRNVGTINSSNVICVPLYSTTYLHSRNFKLHTIAKAS